MKLRLDLRRVARAGLGAATALLCGCAGKTLEVGSDEAPIDRSVIAQCAPSSDLSRRLTSNEELDGALVGRWLRCRGQDLGALYFPGLELSVDHLGNHMWHALEEDGHGGLVASKHAARKGIYYVASPTSVSLSFESGDSQTLVVLFDASGSDRMGIVYSALRNDVGDAVDVAYVRP